MLALIGMTVFTYPTAASWFSQVNQSGLGSAYSEQVKEGIIPTAAEQLAQAHAYNDALSAGALIEAGERLPTSDGVSSDGELDYWNILRVPPESIMARLRIDKIDVDLPVFHGTSDATLDAGVGHLRGTSLPVGGPGTRSVLTAHRGLANATMFTNLDKIESGDRFTIEVMGEMLTYQVFDTKVVAPDETEALRAVPGEDLVTLVTCTPLGINTHRILVTAKRVWPTPVSDLDKLGAESEVPGFPWWLVAYVAGVCAIGAYIWYAGLEKKRPATAGTKKTDAADPKETDAADAEKVDSADLESEGTADAESDSETQLEMTESA